MSDDRAVAQLVAQIAALRGELETAHEAIRQTETERDAAIAAKVQAEAQAALVPALNAQVAELRQLFADPPAGSGVVLARRYMTADGSKHKLLPDAQRHAAKLAISDDLGVTMQVAGDLVDRGDRIMRHLAPVIGRAL